MAPKNEAPDTGPASPFRWNRTISLQTVLLVLGGQCLAVLLWGVRIDSRVSYIEATRAEFRSMQHDRDDRQDHENAAAYDRLSAAMEKMDGKLDRLIEKNSVDNRQPAR